jgi:hypothetical protein
MTDSKWTVEQLKPGIKRFEVLRSEWPRCHRIVITRARISRGREHNENGLENLRAWSPLRPRKRRHDRGQMATAAAHQARTSLVRCVRRPVRQRRLQPLFNQKKCPSESFFSLRQIVKTDLVDPPMSGRRRLWELCDSGHRQAVGL